MLVKLIKQIHSYLREARKKSTRSPKWGHVEKSFKAYHGTCACCGSNSKLQVHHIMPFADFPEKELDPTNLISLCMENLCHLKLGHGDDFHHYNPQLLEDIKEVQEHPERRDKIFDRAKTYRRPM